jgi:hypothetical protein
MPQFPLRDSVICGPIKRTLLSRGPKKLAGQLREGPEMFDRSELANDMGSVVIRAFCNSGMVVATIRYDDFQDAICNKSNRIDNLFNFIDENRDEFLKVMWEKHSRELSNPQNRSGTNFYNVEMTVSDISAILDRLQVR